MPWIAPGRVSLITLASCRLLSADGLCKHEACGKLLLLPATISVALVSHPRKKKSTNMFYSCVSMLMISTPCWFHHLPYLGPSSNYATTDQTTPCCWSPVYAHHLRRQCSLLLWYLFTFAKALTPVSNHHVLSPSGANFCCLIWHKDLFFSVMGQGFWLQPLYACSKQ